MAGSGAWPVRVNRVSEISSALAPEMSARLAQDEDPLSILFVPADRKAAAVGMWARTRGDQVLALTAGGVLAGAEISAPGHPRWSSFAYDDIVLWSLTEELLYGCLEVGAGVDGQFQRAVLVFNTVGRAIVEEALAPLERGILGRSREAAPGSPRVRDTAGLPYGFVSYLTHTLLPLEDVRGKLFEPAVWRRSWRYWTRLVRPAQLFAATDARLAIIREEEELETAGYGYSAWTIPRRWGSDLAVLTEGDGSVALVLRSFPGALHVKAMAENRQALEGLVAELARAERTPSPPA